MKDDGQDWITRYYSSHKYIPDGHSDGELIGKLIRCKDCYAYECQKGDDFGVCKVWMNNTAEDGYCHQGERDETD